MKIPLRSVPGGVILVLLIFAVLFQPVLTSSSSWAQNQPSASTPSPEAAGDFKIPPGTMDALTAILSRRSIRDYTPHPVSEENIKLLLAAGMSAPSAFNERSTEFVVVNDRKLFEEISRLNPNSMQLKKATAAILVCGNQEKEKFKGKGYWQLDGAVAAENILLAAHALGLGAVWTAIYPYPDRIPAVQKLLNLPEHVIPLAIIPIGHPAEKKFRENRYDASRVHYNRW